MKIPRELVLPQRACPRDGFNVSTATLTAPMENNNIVISGHIVYRGSFIETWMLTMTIIGCAIVNGVTAIIKARWPR